MMRTSNKRRTTKQQDDGVSGIWDVVRFISASVLSAIAYFFLCSFVYAVVVAAVGPSPAARCASETVNGG